MLVDDNVGGFVILVPGQMLRDIGLVSTMLVVLQYRVVIMLVDQMLVGVRFLVDSGADVGWNNSG